MVLVAPGSKKAKSPKASPRPSAAVAPPMPPPPPPPLVEAITPPVVPAPPPVVPSSDLRVVQDDVMLEAGSFYVHGESTGSTDQASGQELRRWPSLEEVARRFHLGTDVLRTRASIDGWDSRRSVFQADLTRARQRGIAERIAEQEMPARLAYLGIHNDSIRGLGKLLEKMVPKNGDPACLPRDLKAVLDTACKAAELLAHANGRTKESLGAVQLAVQVAQAQAFGVPVSSLPPGMQASIQPVQETPSGPVTLSLWNILVEARKAAPAIPGEVIPVRDEWDEPSPLPPHLASDRVNQ